MNFQHFFAMASNLNLSVESSFLIAIAVLACVLGTEIAGICILISKISHARRERLRLEEEAELRENVAYDEETGTQSFAVVALLAGGAVPMAAQVALLVLSVAAAVAALVFVVLLIVFRAQGYALISARATRTEESVRDNDVAEASPAPVAEPVIAPVEDEPYVAAEEAVATETDEIPAEDPAAIFDEEPSAPVFEEMLADEPEEETAAEADEETVEAVAAEEAPISVIRRSEPVGLGQTPSGIPVYSSAYPGGQMPVIEKYVTETYKEIIKETNTTTTTNTPAAPAGEKYSPATEEILKAIAELMKLGTQLRMEKELAVEHPAVTNESVPAFADADEDEHEADEPDEDENDVEDAEDAESEGEKSDVEDDYESELFTGNERIVGFDEETGCYIVAHYRKSFEAKLIQARHETKKYYSEIKNALLSYEGNKDRISWTINTYTNDRTQVAKINMRARSLDLYLALDPASLEDSVYHGRDVGAKKKYAETPFLYKVNSPRKLALALELVQRTCEELGLSPIDIEPIGYEEQYPFEATEDLIRRGLIREYLREEKPAVSFELDPDHAPDLPDEDGSVIPANANFTWEFDNEQPTSEPVAESEPEPAPEPVVEEIVESEASEPVAETVEETVEEAIPASTTTTTTHETVKTTERHYTERYYGTPAQPTTYQMLSETTQPIEIKAELTEPVAEAVEEPAEEPVEVVDSDFAEDLEAEELVEESAEEELVEDVPEEVEEIEEIEETVEEETVYEDEPEVEYADETEEEYADETEEEYVDETEEEYVDETEEEYVDEIEEEYADETEEEYADEAEVEYVDESEEEYDEVEYEDETEEVYEDEETEETEEAEEAPTPAAKPTASDPSVALLDVCCFDDHFENGAIVNLETLKQVGLVPESATTLKLYASGMIKGQYTVEANHFTLQALEAINANDGTSIMIR